MHNPLTITCLFDCDASFVGALPHIESKSAGGVDADVRALWSSVETVFRFGSEQCARASVRLTTFTCYSVLLFVLFGKVFFDHGKIGECFLNLQNRCSCKCCRFSLEGARFSCLCSVLRACMCAPRSIKSTKLRTLLCGAFDAVSFSMGDVGSHWSNGLCCGDLVRDNYAADDSSGVFFFSSCRRVCFCSAYLGWTGSWSMGCRD